MSRFEDLGKPLVIKGATSYKSARDLFASLMDINELQKDSYEMFINEVIPFYMNREYSITNALDSSANSTLVVDAKLRFIDYWIEKDTNHTINFCKKHKYSMESSLYARAEITACTRRGNEVLIKPQTVTITVLITKFPELTPKGAMIINGVEKILVSHLEHAYKIRLEHYKTGARKGKKELVFPVRTRRSKRLANKADSGQDTIYHTSNKSVTISQNKNNKLFEVNIDNNPYEINEVIKTLTKSGSLGTTLSRNILGSADELYCNHSENLYESSISIHEAMKNFKMRITERDMLNSKLSLSNRLPNRIIAEDVKDPKTGKLIASANSVLTPRMVYQIAKVRDSVSVLNKMNSGAITVYSNKFVPAEDLFKEVNLTDLMPNMFKGKYINKTIFMDILDKVNTFSDSSSNTEEEIIQQLEINSDNLLGYNLVPDDIISMINMYGEFMADEIPEDDPDSLSVRSIVNISDLFEEPLSARFPGYGDNSDSSVNIMAKLKSILMKTGSDFKPTQASIQSGNFDPDNVSLAKVLKLNLDCPSNATITRSLPSSLLGAADNTSPAAQANHRRKVSLKKVEGRGGVPSTSSDTRPRSVNPSHMGRLDCIESPEGLNIGLVRFFATYAKVDKYGLLTAPFFKVNHDRMQIDYTSVYYLDYDTETKYTRSIQPMLASEDKVVIELYKDIEMDGILTHKKIYSVDYPVEYERIPSTNDKMLIPEQNTPMDNEPDQFKGTWNVVGGMQKIEEYAQQLLIEKYADSYKIIKHKKDWFLEPDNITTFKGSDPGTSISKADEVDLVAVGPEHVISVVSSLTPFSSALDGARYMMSDAHQKQAIPVFGCHSATIETPMSASISKNANGVKVSEYDGRVVFVDGHKAVLQTVDGEEVEIPFDTLDRSSENTAIIAKPCVKPGDIVSKGDILADSNMTENGHIAHGVEVLVGYVPYEGYNFEDSIVFSDRLTKEGLMTSAHLLTIPANGKELVVSDTDKLIVRELDLSMKGEGDRVLEKMIELDVDDLEINTDKLFYTRPRVKGGITTFSRESLKKWDDKMVLKVDPGCIPVIKKILKGVNRNIDDPDITPIGKNGLILPGIMVKPGDTVGYFSEIRKNIKTIQPNQYIIKYRTIVYEGEDIGYVKEANVVEIPDGTRKIEIVIGYDENTKPADKMSGRHGNKGVVSKVIPEADMPYTEDGRRLDILLTPLGIPSRMNISQIFDVKTTELLYKYGLRLQMDTMSRLDVPKIKKLISREHRPTAGSLSVMNIDTGDILTRISVKPFESEWQSLPNNMVLEPGEYCIYSYQVPVDIYGIRIRNSSSEVIGELDLNSISSLNPDITEIPTEKVRMIIQQTTSKPVEIISNQDLLEMNTEGKTVYYRDREEAENILGKTSGYKVIRDKKFLRLDAGGEDTRMIYIKVDEPVTVETLAFVSNQDDDKTQLYDGLTGLPLDMKSTCGVAYILKSRHQGSHKIASRGPNSNKYDINDSPTHGKASDGGQKLGPMETWSISEHGANEIIKELSTFKSDDSESREAFKKFLKAEAEISSIGEDGLHDPEGLAKRMQAADITQKNSPYIFKKIDAIMKSAFINIDYKNKDGVSLDIYKNIKSDSQINNRDFNVTIAQRRRQVYNKLKYELQDGKNINKNNRVNRKDYTDNLTNKDTGFALTMKSDGTIYSPYLPDPENGYSEEYYLFGANTDNINNNYKNNFISEVSKNDDDIEIDSDLMDIMYNIDDIYPSEESEEVDFYSNTNTSDIPTQMTMENTDDENDFDTESVESDKLNAENFSKDTDENDLSAEELEDLFGDDVDEG